MFIQLNPFKGCEKDPFKLAVEIQLELDRTSLIYCQPRDSTSWNQRQLPRSDRDLNIE